MTLSSRPLLAAGTALCLGGFLAAQRPTFTVEVDLSRTPVLAQGNTGTCWSFATTSFFESELERLHGETVDLSEMQPVYFAYLEKARRYLQDKGKGHFTQGGLCHDVLFTIDKHGLLPGNAFTGLFDGEERHSHGEMQRTLKAMLDSWKSSRRGPSAKWEGAVRGVLDAYLGEVPTEITVDGKTLTPMQYAKDVLKLSAADYLTMMSYEHQPFWKKATLKVPDNWLHYDGYLNVPIEVAMETLDKAVAKGFTVAIDMDVSERGFQMEKGTARLSEEMEAENFHITDELRQQTFDDQETTDDHLMHIVGLARDDQGGLWYLTKNSWGVRGAYDGYLYMSRKYVALKMLSFMAHKDAYPAAVLRRVEGD